MIIDTSALFAIILGESKAHTYLGYLLEANDPEISAATLLEARIVARRRNVEGDLDALLSALMPVVVPFNEELSGLAFDAYKTYGPPHAAQLNFGDCFSYATAKFRGKPLVFQGNDFALTDIASAASLADPPPEPRL